MSRFKDDERFKHVDYHHTNLQQTFARIRAQRRAAEKEQERKDAAAVAGLHVLYPNLPRAVK
jgi:hypothetical protein